MTPEDAYTTVPGSIMLSGLGTDLYPSRYRVVHPSLLSFSGDRFPRMPTPVPRHDPGK